jgi:hypothetical protein
MRSSVQPPPEAPTPTTLPAYTLIYPQSLYALVKIGSCPETPNIRGYHCSRVITVCLNFPKINPRKLFNCDLQDYNYCFTFYL